MDRFLAALQLPDHLFPTAPAHEGSPTLARSGLADDALLDLLADAEWVGIDAPFGWPEAMVDALHSYATTGRWPAPAKPEFRYRRTDRFVHEHVLAETEQKLWPLSPSTDRIALTAWRLAGLREAAWERSRLRFDRAGADRVLEVYPAAALLLWGLELRHCGARAAALPPRRRPDRRPGPARRAAARGRAARRGVARGA